MKKTFYIVLATAIGFAGSGADTVASVADAVHTAGKDAEANFNESAKEIANQPKVLREVYGTPTDQKIIDAFLSGHQVYRFRMIEIDTDFVRQKSREGPAAAFGLTLFDNAYLVLEVERTTIIDTGQLAGIINIRGTIRDHGPDSRFTFGIAANDIVRANMSFDGVHYYIQPLGNPGHHIVWQQDPEVRVIID